MNGSAIKKVVKNKNEVKITKKNAYRISCIRFAISKKEVFDESVIRLIAKYFQSLRSCADVCVDYSLYYDFGVSTVIDINHC